MVVVAVVVNVVGDQGVAGVTGSGGNGGGKRDGHEAEAFALEVLHGGAHVFLHKLGHLVLRHGEAVVVGGRRRLIVGPTVGLDAVTASLQNNTNKLKSNMHW